MSSKKNVDLYGSFKIIWISVICFICVFPMGLSPIWNGEIPEHRNQYEIMAQSLKNGHIYLDIEVSEALKNMDNPYDSEARLYQEVPFEWDHAYYDGHYYMYFGIVPVLILFLPYLLLTGQSLTTYHATQIFVILIIFGMFVLFEFLHGKYETSMKKSMLILVSTAFSMASVWFFTTAPALYCTAISSAVCMMVWAIYFWARAFLDDISERKQLIFGIIGSLLGALAFGCRPPVALCNLVIVPFLYGYIKKKEWSVKDCKKIVPILVPYFVVGIALMAYNYCRFRDVFEFGQRYQLTANDQTAYGFFSGLGILRLLNGISETFFTTNIFSQEFPYVSYSGILSEFPIFILGFGGIIFSFSFRKKMKEHRLFGISISMLLVVLVEVMFSVSMAPLIEERYQSDVIFILSIFTFVSIITFYDIVEKKRWLSVILAVLSVGAICTSILLFFVPCDYNYTMCYPEVLEHIRRSFSSIDYLIW